jgi:hypothetical protein
MVGIPQLQLAITLPVEWQLIAVALVSLEFVLDPFFKGRKLKLCRGKLNFPQKRCNLRTLVKSVPLDLGD